MDKKKKVERKGGITSYKQNEDSISQGIEDHHRLKMLLVDSIDKHWYIFDPVSSNIIFTSKLVAGALTHLKEEGTVSRNIKRGLVDLLRLGPVTAVPDDPEPDVWAIKLHINHACNLACEYCYADGRMSDSGGTAKGAYGGPVSSMSRQILEAAIYKLMQSAGERRVVVSFFGGEPLLLEDRFLEAVRLVEEKASLFKKGVIYEMVTNGTKLSPAIIDCLKKYNFRVAVSLDGGPMTHNRQRPFPNGEGTYELVINTINRLSTAGIRVGARMTAIRGRPGFERDHHAIAATSAIAVTAEFDFSGEAVSRELAEAEEHQLFSHYLEVARRILAGDATASKMTIVHRWLAAIAMKRKKLFHCGAGRWDRAVAPDGTFYPCHRFVGMLGYAVGNVQDEGAKFTALPMFEANSAANRIVRRDREDNCALCYAQYLCGGGCPQLGALNTGVIGELPKFYCEERKLRMRAIVRALAEKTAGIYQIP